LARENKREEREEGSRRECSSRS
jgi:hypothetical protein